MNLFEVPSKPNKNVFTRKRWYAIHLQAIVDHQGLFINYDVGYPASVYNAKVFWNSGLYHYRNQLFEDNYLLAGSAYPISLNIIPSFKNPSDSKQTALNKKHSKTHIVVECAFDRLKKRFQLLIELRTKNTKIATDLIETSLILYNLLERDGNEWEESSERVIMYQAVKEAGKIKRQNLMDYVLS
ncbi:44916_t:CDS:2 [Gigaspora margarita]|uniref:44916_t:CDS:1 n=1 Tax=Gigaspora margarita TaxID=4874 RepID=A0ABN7V5Y7_GIGMA|nr:44916_t:CDS:2 [Gigaspora margarita]